MAGLAAIPEADLDSIHVIHWERDIIWDELDSNDESSQLRDDAQNGAAVGAEEEDWDDLDRALNMDDDLPRVKQAARQLPMPVLESLPQRPVKGAHFLKPAIMPMLSMSPSCVSIQRPETNVLLQLLSFYSLRHSCINTTSCHVLTTLLSILQHFWSHLSVQLHSSVLVQAPQWQSQAARTLKCYA